MKIKFLVVLAAIITMVSCKKEEGSENKTGENTAVNQEVDKDLLKVSFGLVVKKDDNMCLYYTEDGTINFTDKKTVWVPVKGSDNEQEVVFKLPKNVLPTHIRVDFGYGKNESQSDVTLKSFKMNYYDKMFEAKDTMIFNYFYPNKDNTVIPAKTAILQRKTKDQPSGPILYPHEPLTAELKKMIQ